MDQGLYDVNRKIDTGFTRLDNEVSRVGALSAAMAGLHPRFQDGNKGELATQQEQIKALMAEVAALKAK